MGLVDELAGRERDNAEVPLDAVDRRIIAELTRDGRMSVTQVAENVHISRAHAYTRIARLTGEGVLTKFTALVDPIKAGLKSSVVVASNPVLHERVYKPGQLANSRRTPGGGKLPKSKN